MRNYQNLRLIVNHDYRTMNVIIYGQIIEGTRLFIIGYDGERLIEQEVTPENELAQMTTFKPLLEVNEFKFNAFLKAFVDYASNVKMVTENENLLQGKLQATEKHLEDMRELVKELIIKKYINEQG